ncbi:MAG: hypothetical protein QMD76_07535 [Anaerosomatales bacterium]|jgi:hypothetical protein|uniref:hypothetical protein n=1 Tax=Parvivirga hydrogeniphila TaxID=2939460 RepID=UPI002260EC84|nr:hypothetical protein [Parvivirga hydrogeniphila]MCL4079682.1 hypothetical protein [Parvivirga hydrogeniphila]MDI6693138.1 hypothetical protein [Anaerosomatales bacterium]MDI6844273.1 hypothetical protein [Anaerosomatales bacterium]
MAGIIKFIAVAAFVVVVTMARSFLVDTILFIVSLGRREPRIEGSLAEELARIGPLACLDAGAQPDYAKMAAWLEAGIGERGRLSPAEAAALIERFAAQAGCAVASPLRARRAARLVAAWSRRRSG